MATITQKTIYDIRQFGFTYPDQNQCALRGVNLVIEQGDFVVLVGASGSGKTTLLRHLKPSLKPYGKAEGEIRILGSDDAADIGFVQQNPENQVVTDKVWHELAFGLESLGIKNDEIRRRVAEVSAFFGIQHWFHKRVSELSGGQLQLLNLASAMILQPRVLVLDEPTSFLDPIAATEWIKTLVRINRELGTTIVMTEHRLEEVLTEANKIVVLNEGAVFMCAEPKTVAEAVSRLPKAVYRAMPVPFRIWAETRAHTANSGEPVNSKNSDIPLTVREGRNWLLDYFDNDIKEELNVDAKNFRNVDAKNPQKFDLENHLPSDLKHDLSMTPNHIQQSALAAGLDQVWFRYEKDGADILRELSISLRKGEMLALLGGNGAGKTTTLKLLAGIHKPQKGAVAVQGRVAYMPQNPQLLFQKNTVKADLEMGNPRPELLEEVIRLCRLDQFLERHPYDLSGGEQHRAAFAKVLLQEPAVLLLDEPTKGVDAEFKHLFQEILRGLMASGKSVLMVSHDVEFCAAVATRCALFFDGAIVSEGAPGEFFAGSSFYTTAANRMTRGILDGVVTVEDALLCLGVTEVEASRGADSALLGRKFMNHLSGVGSVKPQSDALQTAEHIPSEQTKTQHRRSQPKLSKRTMITAIAAVALVPLTLWLGFSVLLGKKYYFISLLILMEVMVPFFVIYEGRKPKARELVVVAVLCAIAVAGRLAFFMLPQFKPVMAVTIIAGIALGGEVGFMVGAVSMLASNVFFSQGMWTPWQMAAMGFIGLIAGIVFRKGWLPRKRLAMSLFGAIIAVLVYGGIMNFASAAMWTTELSWKTLLPYYVTGLPFDAIHGFATAFFLWFGGMPMLEKLERIKKKYGLVEKAL